MTIQPINEAALGRASALCDLRRWDDAVAHLRTILATDPHNEQALCLLARAQVSQAAFDEALTSSLAAIAENPENEWPHRLASQALSHLGRHQEATAMARNAVRLAPNLAQCHALLAEVLTTGGSDLVEAAAAAELAVALDPHDADNHVAVAIVAEGDARLEAAIAAYERALALEPDDSRAHNELARVRLEWNGSGEAGLARAAGGFARALRADPRAAASRANIDVVLQNFLVRTNRWIVGIAFITLWLHGHGEVGVPRPVPVLLLTFPVFSAVRFAFELEPSLRAFLVQRCRDPLLATTVVCEALAAVGLVVGAASGQASWIAFGSSAGFALISRLTLRAWSGRLAAATNQPVKRIIRKPATFDDGLEKPPRYDANGLLMDGTEVGEQ